MKPLLWPIQTNESKRQIIEAHARRCKRRQRLLPVASRGATLPFWPQPGLSTSLPVSIIWLSRSRHDTDALQKIATWVCESEGSVRISCPLRVRVWPRTLAAEPAGVNQSTGKLCRNKQSRQGSDLCIHRPIDALQEAWDEAFLCNHTFIVDREKQDMLRPGENSPGVSVCTGAKSASGLVGVLISPGEHSCSDWQERQDVSPDLLAARFCLVVYRRGMGGNCHHLSIAAKTTAFCQQHR
jgi:hypothetical protein